MGWKGVQYYVYRSGRLGVYTNCPGDYWGGEVGQFLDNCPEGMEIGFDIVNCKPVERKRMSLREKYHGKSD